MNFYKRALQLFSGVLVIAAQPCSAVVGLTQVPCRLELDPIPLSAEARRSLRVDEEFVDFAARDEQDARLLRAIARAYNTLDDWNLEDIAPWLGGDRAPQVDERLRDTPFFRAYPNALTVESSANFHALRPLAQAHDMDDFDLGLMASLFPGARNFPMGDLYLFDVDDPKWAAGMKQKLKVAMTQERYRRMAQLWLSTPQVRASVARSLDHDRVLAATPITPEDAIAATTNRLVQGLPTNGLDTEIFLGLFRTIMNISVRYGLSVGETPFVHDHDKGQFMYDRERFLELIERFCVEEARLTVGRADLLSFIDHVHFGRPMPLSRRTLREMMAKEAIRYLMPMKGRYSQYKAWRLKEADRQLAEDLKQKATRFTGELVDLFPVPAPPKKRCAAATTEVTAPAEKSCARVIPPELDLRAFGSDTKRPIEKLDVETTYVVDFERNGEVDQKVRFGPVMLRWMKKHPEKARELIDAFVWGRARWHGESGYKLYYRSQGEKVYEIKTPSELRGIAFRVDGVWQVVKPSHKDDIHVDVETAKPL